MDNVNVCDLDSTEKGSGARKSSGKARMFLVPFALMGGVARVLEFGLIKYKDWNWSKGMLWSECMSCTFRHLYKWFYCLEEYDDESGEHHLDHAICNLLFLKHYTKSYIEGDDRPPPYTGLDEWVNDFFGHSSALDGGKLNKVPFTGLLNVPPYHLDDQRLVEDADKAVTINKSFEKSKKQGKPNYGTVNCEKPRSEVTHPSSISDSLMIVKKLSALTAQMKEASENYGRYKSDRP